MWKTRYKNTYKTSKPNLIITAVCSFPNLVDTLEKAIPYYKVKELQNDSKFLDIMSDFYFNNGCDFLPLYFEDDVPKLAKLQKLNPLGKGYFWCIGYQCPYLFENKNRREYIGPSYTQYRESLAYWLENFHTTGSGVTSFLFEKCVTSWVYENSKDLPEIYSSRRFQVVANKQIRMQDDKPYCNFLEKNQYTDYLDKMEVTNWYEFIFKAFI